MAGSSPLYPAYLPTRPDGFQPTIDVAPFDGDEPGLRARASKASPSSSVFRGPDSKAQLQNITPRIGTEIRGVQLSELSASELDEVALLAAERGVLAFVSTW